MSDAKHTGESMFQVHIDTELLKKFDEALKINGYKNRADWAREKVRQEIGKAERGK